VLAKGKTVGEMGARRETGETGRDRRSAGKRVVEKITTTTNI
jgi:hypothetical protein